MKFLEGASGFLYFWPQVYIKNAIVCVIAWEECAYHFS